MKIETKTAKSYKEAADMLKGYTFEYASTNYSDDYKTTYRFFGGANEYGGTCFGMIETIEDGKLVNVRFINTFRGTAIDIKIEIEENVEPAAEVAEAMTAIRAFTHRTNVNSLKKQIADTVKEVAFYIRSINYDVWDYLRGNPNDDVDEEGVNKSGASLVEEMNKLAELKAQLAKLAPDEVFDEEAVIRAEIEATKAAIQKQADEMLAKIRESEENATDATAENTDTNAAENSVATEKSPAKFEAGKTYFYIWNEDTGRPHMSRYTVEKRTAKTVVIGGSRSKISYCDWADCEVAKVGYGRYIYAKDLYTVEAVASQIEEDKAWDKMEADADRRYREIEAAKAEREEIMSTPLVSEEAQEIAVEIEITNAAIEETDSAEKTDDEKYLEAKEEIFFSYGEHISGVEFAQKWQKRVMDGWFDISRDGAAQVLKKYGLTCETYLAARERELGAKMADLANNWENEENVVDVRRIKCA